MALNWRGDEIKRKAERASESAINATMQACVLHAKANHQAGAHSVRRFETHTGEAERSIRVTQPARKFLGRVSGQWGSKGIVYFRRLELGFQGKDSAGRVVNAPAYPSLRPAAQVEYPKLGSRVARAFRSGL